MGPSEQNPDHQLIIDTEQAALQRWGAGDPSGYIELAAGEMTYFDPMLEARLTGGAAFREYVAPLEGKIHVDRFEMLEPKVQLHGDVGVLTFNLVDYGEGGKIVSRWNSTEVYCRMDGEWRLIHSHWSLTKPDVKL